MFFEIITQRINTYNDLTNKYRNTELCSKELSSAINKTIAIITVLIIFYFIIFILSIYYVFKCSIKNKWPMWIPILLISLSLMPYIGGLVTISILIYGMAICGSICDAPSDMFSRN